MQTKLHSLIEAMVNVAVGALVALATQLVVFPLYGLKVSLGANLQIMAIFTVVSVVRSYGVRRLFNWMAGWSTAKKMLSFGNEGRGLK